MKFLYLKVFSVIFIGSIFYGCSANKAQAVDERIENEIIAADIVSVTAQGGAGAYTFSVGIKSPDTGCGQYADWWEVLSEDGKLLYRRILVHSHVNEQPFIRSGGPVAIGENEVVIVRGHMNTAGYGTKIYKGSVQGGFQEGQIAHDFAKDVEKQQPQPGDCAF